MYSLEEALIILTEENITKSSQVLRRWLRDGKIEGATIHSKKEGWLIPKDSLLSFVAKNKKKKTIKIENQVDFQKGYEKAWEEISKRDRYLLSQRIVYEEDYYIYRADFLEIAERRQPIKRKEFRQYIDKTLFAKNIKTPRKNISILRLSEWFLVAESNDIFHSNDLPESKSIIEDRILEYLLEKKRREFHTTLI